MGVAPRDMPVLSWIAENHVGDLASIAGVAISVIGFLATLWNVRRSKSAAERAELAASEARSAMRGYQTVSDRPLLRLWRKSDGCIVSAKLI